jgi:hypothetical protein
MAPVGHRDSTEKGGAVGFSPRRPGDARGRGCGNGGRRLR